jgi:hypothetical protein
MGSSPKTPDPPKTNYEKDIRGYVSGVGGSLPYVIGQEAAYRPQFQGLNLGDISSFLNGTSGQQGLYGIQGQATQQSGQLLGQARATELGQMTGQTGAAREFIAGISPEAASQVANAQGEAQRAYASARGLNFQENRMAQQTAREAYASRGMLNSNSSVGAEVMNREGMLGAKRNEAAMRGQQAYEMGQGLYGAPGMAILGGMPLSYQAGQQQVGLGLGAIGSGTPQLFNMDAALGAGAANRQNQFNADSANAQAKAAQNNSNTQAAAAVAAAALMAFSDKNLKTDIRKIGRTPGGLTKYSFKYKSDPGKTHIGVMAQEVEQVKPSAVSIIGGHKAVDYAQIQ